MNALYVTVCIPFLLVLAGFNHAHGFTTFGKTPTNQQTPPPPPHVPSKPCGNHTECYSIPQTSCVAELRNPSRKSCLCGDYKAPANGVCRAEHKGPHHMCTTDNDCVYGAACVPMSNGIPASQDSQKVCKCTEGFTEMEAECSRADHFGINAAMALLLVALCRTLF